MTPKARAKKLGRYFGEALVGGAFVVCLSLLGYGVYLAWAFFGKLVVGVLIIGFCWAVVTSLRALGAIIIAGFKKENDSGNV